MTVVLMILAAWFLALVAFVAFMGRLTKVAHAARPQRRAEDDARYYDVA
jgi:hypothetical protein